jgi:RNA-binding protein YhbY
VPQLRETHSNAAIKRGGQTQELNTTSAGKKRYAKRTLAQGKPTVCAGKGRASGELLKEIEKQLKKDEMVKARILKSALVNGEIRLIASEIARQTEASLVEVRGHTFMLYKHDKK